MFKGFTGCIIAGGSLLAGAVFGSISIMIGGAAAGLAVAAVSCELNGQLLKKEVPYPTYRY